ncbi:hypothetical protein K435DRAFT_789347 [Dendrothele bispora CBS 962.96]|uniref:Uncharacterized protein n=1 Tax=Dendrothele bispora (strain CBS 962.96) TaxID=1314807 RepID=A0A4S8MUX6_DENBC|nr:hypothetical protein K435DRAFT_789347 [Dendrothele bispora CBS 962.96]
MAIPVSVPSSREDRPVLPPLHTLALPTFPSPQTRLPGIHHFDAINATHDSNSERHSQLRLGSRSCHHPSQRQCSVSSSTSSRTPSPTPSDSSISSSSTSAFPSTPFTPLTPGSSAGRPKMRLIPSTLEEADAVVVVPPQSFYDESNPSTSLLDAKVNGSGKSKALLLVGPALRHLRHPQRQIAKGARIHPYKIERTPQTAARTRLQPAPKPDGYFAYAPTYNNQRRASTSSTSTDLSVEDDVSRDVRMLSL